MHKTSFLLSIVMILSETTTAYSHPGHHTMEVLEMVGHFFSSPFHWLLSGAFVALLFATGVLVKHIWLVRTKR